MLELNTTQYTLFQFIPHAVPVYALLQEAPDNEAVMLLKSY